MSADKVIFFPKVLQILEFDSNRAVRDEEDGFDDYDDDLYALIMHLCHLLVLHLGGVRVWRRCHVSCPPGWWEGVWGVQLILGYSWESCRQGLLSL